MRRNRFDQELAAAQESQAAGDSVTARALLDQALRHVPSDQRARNLLGLTLFKLGDLVRAETIYRALIDDHPADPTLRVNLGLVFLKLGASNEAARCFTTAIELQPEHVKAQNYLGLALAQKGDHAQARVWFLRSGNAAMAERMEELASADRAHSTQEHTPVPRRVANEAPVSTPSMSPAEASITSEFSRRSDPPKDAFSATGSTQPFGMKVITQTGAYGAVPVARAEEAAVHSLDTEPSLPPASRVASSPAAPASSASPVAGPASSGSIESALSRMEESDIHDDDRADTAEHAKIDFSTVATNSTNPPAASETIAQIRSGRGSQSAPESLVDFSAARQIATEPARGCYSIGPASLVVQVRGELLTRLDGMVASFGSATLTAELKRFRGKPTEKSFGEGARRMLRASGEGRYVIATAGRVFTPLELADEPAYFREEVLFSFADSLTFENGRVPSKTGQDLHLVHLRGRGQLLLVTHGAPHAVEVHSAQPLRIPLDQLVGWHGATLQPRLVSIVEDAPELGVALELSGEGMALVDVPDES